MPRRRSDPHYTPPSGLFGRIRHTSLHYCRLCEATFESDPRRSAHIAAVMHVRKIHHQPQSIQCTRYCEMVEQPEEQKAGHRMYGPGYTRPDPPLIRAEDLAPEDEHA